MGMRGPTLGGYASGANLLLEVSIRTIHDSALVRKLLLNCDACTTINCNDPQDRLNLSCVKTTLAEAKGGASGVKRLLEIRIRYAGEASLKQWSNFLAPARHEGQVWFVGNGPALRFISSKEPYENQVEGIVLEVESLEKAKQVLDAKRLIGKATSEDLELDQGRTFGLKILFRQTNSRSE